MMTKGIYHLQIYNKNISNKITLKRNKINELFKKKGNFPFFVFLVCFIFFIYFIMSVQISISDSHPQYECSPRCHPTHRPMREGTQVSLPSSQQLFFLFSFFSLSYSSSPSFQQLFFSLSLQQLLLLRRLRLVRVRRLVVIRRLCGFFLQEFFLHLQSTSVEPPPSAPRECPSTP